MLEYKDFNSWLLLISEKYFGETKNCSTILNRTHAQLFLQLLNTRLVLVILSRAIQFMYMEGEIGFDTAHVCI